MSSQFLDDKVPSTPIVERLLPGSHSQSEVAAEHSKVSLHKQIGAKLAQRGIAIGDRLTVGIQDGVVTVSGRVPTYYQRQLIVHTIRRIPGVVRVNDAIDVVHPDNATRQLAAPSTHDRASQKSRPRRRLPIGAAFASLVALLLASCGPATPVPVYPVQGKLTYEGEPASGAFLVLHPVGHSLPSSARPTARVGQDGSFQLGTFSSGDGAPEGDYTVTVEWQKLVKTDGETVRGPNIVPIAYSKPQTSSLHVKVAKGKNDWEPLKLSARSADGKQAVESERAAESEQTDSETVTQ